MADKKFEEIQNLINSANVKLSLGSSNSKDIIFHEDDNNVMFTAYSSNEKEIQMTYNKNESFLRLSGKYAKDFENVLKDSEIHPQVYKEFNERLNIFRGKADKYNLNNNLHNHKDLTDMNIKQMSEDVLANIEKSRKNSSAVTSKRKLS